MDCVVNSCRSLGLMSLEHGHCSLVALLSLSEQLTHKSVPPFAGAGLWPSPQGPSTFIPISALQEGAQPPPWAPTLVLPWLS